MDISPESRNQTTTLFNGKTVWSRDNFDYTSVQVGDYVEQAIVDDAVNCLPPACLRDSCTQMGDPYSHRHDPDSGKWRPTYATFKRVSGEWPHGIWEYCGHCFHSENVERGDDPASCK